MSAPPPFTSWREFVRQWAQLTGFPPSPSPPGSTASSGPTVVIFSPHPDDECLVGALPLRLLRECGARVVNVAVTLGHAHQRERRRAELQAACRVLGFELVIPNRGDAFANVHPEMAGSDPEQWTLACDEFLALLRQLSPRAVFCPHDDDFHPTHLGTRALAIAALDRFLGDSTTPVDLFETEFWHPMNHPNLLVGVSENTEALLLQATACHAGEVERNPYHLRHPARMIDNVRRGSEVVMGIGGPAAGFPFGEIYRRSHLRRAHPPVIFPPETLDPATALLQDWLHGDRK